MPGTNKVMCAWLMQNRTDSQCLCRLFESVDDLRVTAVTNSLPNQRRAQSCPIVPRIWLCTHPVSGRQHNQHLDTHHTFHIGMQQGHLLFLGLCSMETPTSDVNFTATCLPGIRSPPPCLSTQNVVCSTANLTAVVDMCRRGEVRGAVPGLVWRLP